MTEVDSVVSACFQKLATNLSPTGNAAQIAVFCSSLNQTLTSQQSQIQGLTDGLNTLYTLLCGSLVFLMHGGFAMLCAGSITHRNVLNILMQTILDATVSAIMFYLVGFGFAYGEGLNPNGFIGDGLFGLADFVSDYGSICGSASCWQQFMFQWAFAATAATIPAGCVAERFNFNAYLAYTFFLSGFVYPVVVHWAWSQYGWLGYLRIQDPLFGCGYIDFAGSGVVHMVGGLAGLMGCILVGPRMGRFGIDGHPVEIRGHNTTLIVLGTVILWFGWYGFNPGSMLILNTTVAATVVGRTSVTTTLSGSAGSLMSMLISYFRTGAWDLVQVCNGALVGFVAVTASCHVIEPWAAILCGMTASVVFAVGCEVLLKYKIDDPLAAAPMHAGCGAWGVFFVGLLAKKEYVMESYTRDVHHWGLFYPGGGGLLLGCQVLGIIVIGAWVCTLMGILFYILRYFNMLRISPAEELCGLDMSKHGGSAYTAIELSKAVLTVTQPSIISQQPVVVTVARRQNASVVPLPAEQGVGLMEKVHGWMENEQALKSEQGEVNEGSKNEIGARGEGIVAQHLSSSEGWKRE